jgi:hypothetical protein
MTLPYGLIRPFLFGLDAEQAHELTLAALGATSHTPFKFAYKQARVKDASTLMGITFPNKVGPATPNRACFAYRKNKRSSIAWVSITRGLKHLSIM